MLGPVDRALVDHNAKGLPSRAASAIVWPDAGGHYCRWREAVVVVMNFPKCQKCGNGDLVPLSDYGGQGAAVYFKAWVCTNPTCGFNIKIRNGDLYLEEPINNGSGHSPRLRV